MGVSAGDFDSDGDEDLFVTHLTRETIPFTSTTGKAAFMMRPIVSVSEA